MQKKRTILFLSEEFGFGHTKAAEALVQSITHLEPSIRTRIIEPGKMLHPKSTSFFLRSYKKIITHYPNLWKMLYMSNKKQSFPPIFQSMIYHFFHRNIERLLGQIEPDLVICTHPFGSMSLSKIKKSGLPIRCCTVITDLHVHKAWVHPEVDHYIVSDAKVKEQLIQLGVHQDKIAVTGIPIRMNFWKKHNKVEVRRFLSLRNLPTVIIMGGGWGVGNIKDIAFSLLKWKDAVQIVICTGMNTQLKQSLMRSKHFKHPNIIITGFIDRIDKLFDAADLIITKPGGITCFEALTKGVPMLLYDPIPGHEEHNLSHLVNSKLAVSINHLREMDEWIEKLLLSPSTFEPWLARMKQFQENMNPLAGAKSIIQLLNQS